MSAGFKTASFCRSSVLTITLPACVIGICRKTTNLHTFCRLQVNCLNNLHQFARTELGGWLVTIQVPSITAKSDYILAQPRIQSVEGFLYVHKKMIQVEISCNLGNLVTITPFDTVLRQNTIVYPRKFITSFLPPFSPK